MVVAPRKEKTPENGSAMIRGRGISLCESAGRILLAASGMRDEPG